MLRLAVVEQVHRLHITGDYHPAIGTLLDLFVHAQRILKVGIDCRYEKLGKKNQHFQMHLPKFRQPFEIYDCT